MSAGNVRAGGAFVEITAKDATQAGINQSVARFNRTAQLLKGAGMAAGLQIVGRAGNRAMDEIAEVQKQIAEQGMNARESMVAYADALGKSLPVAGEFYQIGTKISAMLNGQAEAMRKAEAENAKHDAFRQRSLDWRKQVADVVQGAAEVAKSAQRELALAMQPDEGKKIELAAQFAYADELKQIEKLEKKRQELLDPKNDAWNAEGVAKMDAKLAEARARAALIMAKARVDMGNLQAKQQEEVYRDGAALEQRYREMQAQAIEDVDARERELLAIKHRYARSEAERTNSQNVAYLDAIHQQEMANLEAEQAKRRQALIDAGAEATARAKDEQETRGNQKVGDLLDQIERAQVEGDQSLTDAQRQLALLELEKRRMMRDVTDDAERGLLDELFRMRRDAIANGASKTPSIGSAVVAPEVLRYMGFQGVAAKNEQRAVVDELKKSNDALRELIRKAANGLTFN